MFKFILGFIFVVVLAFAFAFFRKGGLPKIDIDPKVIKQGEKIAKRVAKKAARARHS